MPNSQMALYRNPGPNPGNTPANLLSRVLGGRVDLRKGGRLPEELPIDQAGRLLDLLTRRFVKRVNPVTGEAVFDLAQATAISVTSGEPCMPTLCRQAQTMLGDGLRALLSIHPLDPSGDPELVEARKAILEGEFKALMQELCHPQPRFFQIEVLLREARGNLAELIKEVSGNNSLEVSVNTPEEDAVITNIRLLLNYLGCLYKSFCDFRDEHFGLACLQQEIVFALQTVGETVGQARLQLLEDGVTEADLKVIRIQPPKVPYVRAGCTSRSEVEKRIADTMTVDSFLALNESEAARLADVVSRAGLIGIRSGSPYVNAIEQQLGDILDPPEYYQLIRFFSKSEVSELAALLMAKPRAKDAEEIEKKRPSVSPALAELIKRNPSTWMFLFKLHAEWSEVKELVDRAFYLKHSFTLVASDQTDIKR